MLLWRNARRCARVNDSSKWPRYVVAVILAAGAGLGGFIAYELTHGQPIGFTQADVDYAKDHISGVSDSDIRALLAEGFTAAEVVELLKAGFRLSYVKRLKTAGFSNGDMVNMAKAGFNRNDLDKLSARIAQAQRNGTDQFGLSVAQLHDLVMAITAKLNFQSTSGDPDQQQQQNDAEHLQGQVAKSLLATVINIEQPAQGTLPDGTVRNTSYDIVTQEAIMEVTTGDGGDKVRQLGVYMASDTTNKPIIIYAPNMPLPTADQIVQAAYNTNPNIQVYVVTNIVEESSGPQGVSGREYLTPGQTGIQVVFQILRDLGEHHSALAS